MKQSEASLHMVVAAAIMAFLSTTALYYGSLSFLFMLALPLPIVWMILKYELRYGLLAALLTTVYLLTFLGHSLAVCLLILQFVLLGVLIGLLLKNKMTIPQSQGALFGATLIIAGVNLFLTFWLNNRIMSEIAAEVKTAMEQAARFYQTSGLLDEAGSEQYLAFSDQMVEMVQTFLPSSVVLSALLMTVITYFLSRYMMTLIGYTLPDQFVFIKWQIPWYSIWLVICGLGLTLAGDGLSWRFMEIAGKNLLCIAALIFGVLGIAVIVYYIETVIVTKMVKALLALLLIFYLPVTLVIAFALGMLDAVINLRRPKKQEE